MMKKANRFLVVVVTVIAGFGGTHARGQANSWSDSGGGTKYWEQTNYWSLGVAPASTHSHIYITNTTTKIVRIDATTVSTAPGSLTISNLTLSGPASTVNNLDFRNSGTATPLRVLNGVTVNNGGTLSITNGALRVDGVSGGGFTLDGEMALRLGLVVTTNVTTRIGNAAGGSLTVQGGTWYAREVRLGEAMGTCGTLTVAGGTTLLSSDLVVGALTQGTGTVWVTGGELAATNGAVILSTSGGRGTVVVSNGVLRAGSLQVCASSGGVGTLTVAGGSLSVAGNLDIASPSGTTGYGFLYGGELVATNGATTIGYCGNGSLTVTGGTARLGAVTITYCAFSSGTLAISGGRVNATSIDTCFYKSAPTRILLSGGTLSVGGLVVVGGGGGTLCNASLVQSGGTLEFGELDIGRFGWASAQITNSTVTGGSLVLAAAGDSRGTWASSYATVTLSGDLTLSWNGSLSYAEATFDAGSLTVTNGTVLLCKGYEAGSADLRLNNLNATFRDLLIAESQSAIGTVNMTNSTVTVLGELTVGKWGLGYLNVHSGTLIATNATAYIAKGSSSTREGVAQMTVNNGTVRLRDLTCGYYNHQNNWGTLSVAGGTVHLGGDLIAGQYGRGAVNVSAGQLVVTNGTFYVSYENNFGRLDVSGGSVLANDLIVARSSTGNGTLTMSGGQINLRGGLGVCQFFGWGTVLLSGGILTATNAESNIGYYGYADMTISDSNTTQFADVYLGRDVFSPFPPGTGTLALNGGTCTTIGTMFVGNVGSGIVVATSGTLLASNGTGTAALDGRKGRGVLGGATVTVDKLNITSTSGQFLFNGGVLNSRATQITNAQPFAVGDGSSAVTFRLLGGTHAFANGLIVTNNAVLVGTGTVAGGLTNLALVSATNGELRLVGPVNGSGTFRADTGGSGATLTFGGGGTVNALYSTGQTVAVTGGNLTLASLYAQPGTLTVSGGALIANGGLTAGAAAGRTGTVWVTGGQLIVTNNDLRVGESGIGQLTVSNGTVQSRLFKLGYNAGSAGTLTIAGGTNVTSGELAMGYWLGSAGAIWLNGGALIVTNAPVFPVGSGVGQITVSNGVALLREVVIGTAGAGSARPCGTLTVAGGTVNLSSYLSAGETAVSTGLVNLAGGDLWVTNGAVILGNAGRGALTVAAGQARLSSLLVGNQNGSVGTLTVNGGTLYATNFVLGVDNGALGMVFASGGELRLTNATQSAVCDVRRGRLQLSSGTLTVDRLLLVNTGSFQFGDGRFDTGGTVASNGLDFIVGKGSPGPHLHLRGGVHSYQRALHILTAALVTGCGTIHGTVVNEGFFRPDCGTMAIHGSVTNLGGASIIASNGALIAFYNLVVNYGLINATGGSVVFYGGVENYGEIVLDKNGDADGDGMPNVWEEKNGLDPLDPTGNNGAAADIDGDGFSNLQEYWAGTDPTRAESYLHITALDCMGDNVRVSWHAGGGRTNYVQAVTGSGFTNSFNDVSAPLFIPDNGDVLTNWVDVGAGTNRPARFYRIRAPQP
jgi:T5SS/PEP-CTERM-associated repeat protein